MTTFRGDQAAWPLKEAKARFSELVRRAQRQGPQRITVHGRPAAVLLSEADYDRLNGKRQSFWEFLRASPLVGVELDIERDKSLPRDIEL